MIRLTGTLVFLAVAVLYCDGLKRTKELQTVRDYFKPPPHIHGKFAYVTWTKEKGYDIKIFASGYATQDYTGVDWVAKARFQNMVNKTGWAFLEVESKNTWPDEMQMYAAGMAEGYLTRDLIYYFWQNLIEQYCDDKPTLCRFVKKFVAQNQDWVDQSISQLKDSSPYWHHVHLMYEQLKGLAFGFGKAANGTSMKINALDFVLINILGDLGDLESALDPNPKGSKPADMRGDGHCSVLIKLIEKRDIYASHVSWWRYESMLRIIKRYKFPLSTSSGKDGTPVPGASISMSSYPGMLWSMDDFYTISSGLFVTETSIANFNKDLWGKISPKNSLYTGVRVMVANRLAHDGREWTKLFTLFNSGTYNNQWMVLNYNLFEPERPIQEGLLWISEQLPGLVVSKDVTSVLNETGYWASYNIPYTNDVYQLSGVNKMQSKYGDYYSYDKCPRAQIFARDQTKVQDLDSAMQLMRYNDYQNDPLSKCNCTPPYSAINAISARCDLNPEDGKYPFPSLGHRPMGGTDMKLTNLDMFLLQQFVAIGGPTYDPLPPFQWSKSSVSKLRHFGQPDKFQFEPLIHHWKWL